MLLNKLRKGFYVALSCCMLSTAMFAVPVLAATEQNYEITDETVITDDNIQDVLSHLGLGGSSFVAAPNVTGVNTVGDLKNAINKASASLAGNHVAVIAGQKEEPNVTRATGTKTMTQTFDVDAYTIDVTVSAGYSGKSWTSANGVSASVDSDQALITYKIADNQLSATSSATVVKVSGYVKVQAYVGVGDVGLVKVGDPQKNTLTANFYAKNYL